MCGIYGYVGVNAITETMKGIKRLEYRGYDSAGIGFIDTRFHQSKKAKDNQNVTLLKDGLSVIKQLGTIDKLELLVRSLKPTSNIAIGHTRWATHGNPSVINAHPHFSKSKDFVVVHNGIIENYQALKTKFNKSDLLSETDTEVVAKLLGLYYNGNVLDTLINVCDMLKGSYAFEVIHKDFPDTIFIATHNSPCVVGTNKDCGVVCSDINSMQNVEKMYVVPSDTFGIVKVGQAKFFDTKSRIVHLKEITVEKKNTDTEIKKYKHNMLKEIYEIPKSINNTVSRYDSIEKISNALPKKVATNLKHIVIVGCGTAYHAGLMGKQILEEKCNISVDVCIASEFRYSKLLLPKNTLMIFVSQSGETADTLEACKLAKANGFATVAITNVEYSSICLLVDYCLYTVAGTEIGVASTKVYVSQVCMFHLIASYMLSLKTQNENLLNLEVNNLNYLADIIKENNIENVCKKISKIIKDSESIYMIGRSMDYYLALESSLKLKEISYIHSEALPAGELKHGTISLIDNKTFVFAFITQTKLKDKTLSNLSEVLSRGGQIILLSPFKFNLSNRLFKFIQIPLLDDLYSPLVAVVYMQLISYYTSISLGRNPDRPRNLAKSVTVE